MGVPKLIEALLERSAYPPLRSSGGGVPEVPVELIQTHISYILLTESYAYKIKKPVDFGFLDFSTLDKRLHYCTEEVRLNRRLAPDIYLGVVPVTEEDGLFMVEGSSGEIVEYGVKMRRLDERKVLKELIKADHADAGVISRVADRLSDFHREADGGERISGFGSPQVIEANVTENFSQTEGFIGETISLERFDLIKAYSAGFIAKNKTLFLRRMAEGRIRDCHGDIHSEHISIDRSIEIIDCIEFNERFRFSDTVADIAFLSMDLDYLGRGDLARALEERYFEESGDADGMELINFYKCYRAYVRGKVEGFKVREEEVDPGERLCSEVSAIRYFHLSEQYALADGGGGAKGGGKVRPLSIALRGLSGSGKSTLASELVRGTGIKLLRSDIVRKEFLGIDPYEAHHDGYGEGLYTAGITARTYKELISRACGLIRVGRSVVVDATFVEEAELRALNKGVKECGAVLHIIECEASIGVLKERLDRRATEKSVSDADYGILLKQKKIYENTELPVIKAYTETDLKGLMLEINRKIFY